MLTQLQSLLFCYRRITLKQVRHTEQIGMSNVIINENS